MPCQKSARPAVNKNGWGRGGEGGIVGGKHDQQSTRMGGGGEGGGYSGREVRTGVFWEGKEDIDLKSNYLTNSSVCRGRQVT